MKFRDSVMKMTEGQEYNEGTIHVDVHTAFLGNGMGGLEVGTWYVWRQSVQLQWLDSST